MGRVARRRRFWRLVWHSERMNAELMVGRSAMAHGRIGYSETDAGWDLATPQSHDSWRLVKQLANKNRSIGLGACTVDNGNGLGESKKRRMIIVAFRLQ